MPFGLFTGVILWRIAAYCDWLVRNFMPLRRHRCVGVAEPYKPHDNDFIQTWRADDIRLYSVIYCFERSEINPAVTS